MKLKARVKPLLFLSGQDKGIKVEQLHTVEILHNRKWRIGGDDTGLWKYKTAAEAEAKRASIDGLEVQAEIPVGT